MKKIRKQSAESRRCLWHRLIFDSTTPASLGTQAMTAFSAASAIWPQTLSGWPSATDSEVHKRFVRFILHSLSSMCRLRLGKAAEKLCQRDGADRAFGVDLPVFPAFGHGAVRQDTQKAGIFRNQNIHI